ncbi:hypothetical protein R2083_08005 [Nitrosomonas sp. Is35]|uniref:hypothetical protein n=1 Tax=Nitrosomonas sp. Is35 TaxID=3080534 RepID=UPI00294ACD40|nr:hypothetical protein [Nitrosomonas sp. Is35]MDV6347456.1 hypothetical protein [Nitrosomonas sp. Is35]
MANANPPKKNQAFVTYVTLRDATDNLSMKSNPTIAAGDFKISLDGASFVNLTNLPTVTPSGSVGVKLDIPAAQMNADQVLITWIDQSSPKEWADGSLAINTTA